MIACLAQGRKGGRGVKGKKKKRKKICLRISWAGICEKEDISSLMSFEGNGILLLFEKLSKSPWLGDILPICIRCMTHWET